MPRNYDPIHEMSTAYSELQAENARLKQIIADGEAVVEDFMRNIAQCALQDYARLNQFLIDASLVTKPRSGQGD